MIKQVLEVWLRLAQKTIQDMVIARPTQTINGETLFEPDLGMVDQFFATCPILNHITEAKTFVVRSPQGELISLTFTVSAIKKVQEPLVKL